ncbi:MAG TPA: Hpt domain-containing protein [Usitatibacter sp.]|nr:Hpt domain-containing protein [Usitatibacter sp.]
MPVLCHSTLASISGGDALVQYEILELFVHLTREAASSLDKAFDAQALAEVRQIAHLLNGRSAMIGALSLADTCARMERLARCEDWTALREAHESFNREWTGVREAVYGVLSQADGRAAT